MKESTVRVLRSSNFRDATFNPGLPPQDVGQGWLLIELQGPKRKIRAVVRCIDCPDMLGHSVWWFARELLGEATIAPLHALGAKTLAYTTDANLTGKPTQLTVTQEKAPTAPA